MKAAAFKKQNEVGIIDAPVPKAGRGRGRPQGPRLRHLRIGPARGPVRHPARRIASWGTNSAARFMRSAPACVASESASASPRCHGSHAANAKRARVARATIAGATACSGSGSFPAATRNMSTCGERSLLKLPDNVSSREGALVEPLSVGLHGVNRARIKPGDGMRRDGRRADRPRGADVVQGEGRESHHCIGAGGGTRRARAETRARPRS